MKIAQLSTPFIAVPPPNYGGTELVVNNITEKLVEHGHDVTLYAPGDSHTSAKLIAPYPQALSSQEMLETMFSPLAQKLVWTHSLPSLHHAVDAFKDHKKYDIIHDHFHYIGLLLAQLIDTPVVSTYHGDFSSAMQSPIEKQILESYPRHPWVAISESQKRTCSLPLNFVAVIHHGVVIKNYSFHKTGGEYIAWLGRITQKKGLTEAIQLAKQKQYPLKIAGVVHPRDEEYFHNEIKPHIDGTLISMVGGLNYEEKKTFYQNAKMLLYPISWEEPFGLVMIEAMATGTPVIAFARGAAPEIIADNNTGFLINHSTEEIRGDFATQQVGMEGLSSAFDTIISKSTSDYELMRNNARSHVEEYFTTDVMVKKYEDVYKKLIETS